MIDVAQSANPVAKTSPMTHALVHVAVHVALAAETNDQPSVPVEVPSILVPAVTVAKVTVPAVLPAAPVPTARAPDPVRETFASAEPLAKFAALQKFRSALLLINTPPVPGAILLSATPVVVV